MRLALVIASLRPGGAESVLTFLANRWAAAGHEVTVITLAALDTDALPLAPTVERVALDLLRRSGGTVTALLRNAGRVRRLRAALRAARPDVVVSFIARMNVLTLLAARGTGLPVVACERVHPLVHPIGRVWERLRARTYRRADAIAVQTDDLAAWARGFVGADRVHVLSNPLLPQAAAERSLRAAPPPDDLRAPYVAAMGRLAPQKGFDLLLDAFSRAARDLPEWSLVVLGDGRERARLEARVAALGLEGRVRLPGWVDEPASVLRGAELFVLPSRYEGFPNALVEAMSVGRPVLAFDCPGGVGAIVRDGVDGVLASPEDVGALAGELASLLRDPERRRRLGARAIEIRERFAPERVLAGWNAMIEAVRERRAVGSGSA